MSHTTIEFLLLTLLHVCRYQGSVTSPITQMAFSPAKNVLVWTDSAGDLTRWRSPIPADKPDPVKPSTGAAAVGIPVKRRGTPTLFDDDADVAMGNQSEKSKRKDVDLDDDFGDDLGIDNDWILDDVGAMGDDDGEARRLEGESGVREMGKWGAYAAYHEHQI